jgi:hypothetical protein
VGDEHVGCAADNNVREARGVHHMLAVVEHEEQPPRAQRAQQGVGERSPWLLAQAERRRHGVRQALGIGDGRQVGEEGAVGELRQRLGGELQCQAGLAGAAGAGERQ